MLKVIDRYIVALREINWENTKCIYMYLSRFSIYTCSLRNSYWIESWVESMLVRVFFLFDDVQFMSSFIFSAKIHVRHHCHYRRRKPTGFLPESWSHHLLDPDCVVLKPQSHTVSLLS